MERLERITITIKPVLLGEIKKIAEQERESVSGIINRYLEEVLFEKKRKKAGFRVLEVVKKYRLDEEQVEKAHEELSKMRKEWER
ncbi:MAG: hypothetical protein LWW94_09570 [Candidatus Desulfofervidaceae bacterium]|nr:hypothetical protein [Candidatus Desulfofervidaceae bacterium]